MKQASLLIVDDEVNVARTLQMIFERDGYRVTSAYSCAEALSLFADGHAKLDGVITDLNMEREDIGFDVVRAARQLTPARWSSCAPVSPTPTTPG